MRDVIDFLEFDFLIIFRVWFLLIVKDILLIVVISFFLVVNWILRWWIFNIIWVIMIYKLNINNLVKVDY